MKMFTRGLGTVILGSLVVGIPATIAQTTRAARPAPIVIPRPAVPDGSNMSRAPFPAQRPFDDVKGPDGQAIDPDIPPNTPATEPPAPPPPRVAVLQNGRRFEPALSMTGSAGVTATLGATQMAPAIRSQPMESRDQLFSEIESRLAATDKTVEVHRGELRDITDEGRRVEFKKADTELAERERALQHSIKIARKAEAQEWEAARAQVAADFDAYAAAGQRFDNAAGLAP